jgi:hypothetical protein
MPKDRLAEIVQTIGNGTVFASEGLALHPAFWLSASGRFVLLLCAARVGQKRQRQYGRRPMSPYGLAGEIVATTDRAFWTEDVARRRHKIIQNRLALRGEESVSVGHRRYTTGSTRRTHRCASTLSPMTESCCAARRPRQSMTARLPSDRMRSCMLPHLAPSGCWRCGTLCPVSKSARELATATR